MDKFVKQLVESIDGDLRQRAVDSFEYIGGEVLSSLRAIKPREAVFEEDRCKALLAIYLLAENARQVYESPLFSDEERELAESIAKEAEENDDDGLRDDSIRPHGYVTMSR